MRCPLLTYLPLDPYLRVWIDRDAFFLRASGVPCLSYDNQSINIAFGVEWLHRGPKDVRRSCSQRSLQYCRKSISAVVDIPGPARTTFSNCDSKKRSTNCISLIIHLSVPSSVAVSCIWKRINSNRPCRHSYIMQIENQVPARVHQDLKQYANALF